MDIILLIDDQPSNLRMLSQILADEAYDIRAVTSGKMAYTTVTQSERPDLIILDIMMPDMDGYETCQRLKQVEGMQAVPIIFISALDDLSSKVKAFEYGGVDYITKPFHAEEVLARVKTHLELRHKTLEIERLKQAEIDQLAAINSLQNEVLRIVSHDLQNPISIVSAANEFIRTEIAQLPTRDSIERYVNMITRATDRMNNLVSDLLDLAHLENQGHISLEDTNLSALLRIWYGEFLLSAQEQDIHFTLDLPPNDIYANLSMERFGQVLQNLVSNALKYTDPQGTVTVAGGTRPDQVWVRISDTGLGIPSEDMPHLFEKFYRVKRQQHMQQPGSGLGMAIVKAIVDSHQGHIQVESELNKGTTITITLPCTSSKCK